jgi:hypothetical protein
MGELASEQSIVFMWPDGLPGTTIPQGISGVDDVKQTSRASPVVARVIRQAASGISLFHKPPL